MDKIDFKKTLDSYQAKRGVFRLVEVPPLHYLMIDGHGDPNTSPAFADAIETLSPIASQLKFASKQGLGRDYVVPPLEGLWWADDMDAFSNRDKSQWDWTLLLLVPDWIDQAMVDAAVEQVAAKDPPARLGDVRFDLLDEGLCVQTLHVGSFDDEGPVLQKLHEEFIPNQGLTPTGHHHEVYFSDFRRTAPDKLRTLLRQPVAQASSTD